MLLSTDDMCRIAADFAEEYGADALACAQRAVVAFEVEGAHERAQFWYTVCILLADIVENRIDPLATQTIH